eukprot:g48884.t1
MRRVYTQFRTRCPRPRPNHHPLLYLALPGAATSPDAEETQREFRRLACIFGALYFVQGIAEPNFGLVAQPLRKMLKDFGYGVDHITTLVSIVGLPWSCKPLFGFLTDFVPIFGYRRKSWLCITSTMVCIGLGALFFHTPSAADEVQLRAMLMVPTVGVAFGDVIADALMVGLGQPMNITARLQSVQWTCFKIAKVITATLGGWLAAHGKQAMTYAFLLCALSALVPFTLALCVIQEPPFKRRKLSLSTVLSDLREAFSLRSLQILAVFGVIVDFQPLSSTILYLYTTTKLGVSEQEYGVAQSIRACAGVAAAMSYSIYSQRFSARQLLYWCALTNLSSSMVFVLVSDAKSLMIVQAFAGAAGLTSYLVILDLLARAVPSDVAGTVFACMMSLLNATGTLSTYLGGKIFAALLRTYAPLKAFDILVTSGCTFTIVCLFYVPFIDLTDLEKTRLPKKKGGTPHIMDPKNKQLTFKMQEERERDVMQLHMKGDHYGNERRASSRRTSTNQPLLEGDDEEEYAESEWEEGEGREAGSGAGSFGPDQEKRLHVMEVRTTSDHMALSGWDKLDGSAGPNNNNGSSSSPDNSSISAGSQANNNLRQPRRKKRRKSKRAVGGGEVGDGTAGTAVTLMSTHGPRGNEDVQDSLTTPLLSSGGT